MTSKKQLAFSLVELVVVIAVISLLMSLIVPISQNILFNARKTKSQSTMKRIASAYMNIYQNIGYIPAATSGEKLSEFFAENKELNNANFFVFPGDLLAAKVERELIVPIETDVSPWSDTGDFSVYLIGNIVEEVNPDTTPIAFSRGLQSDGTWDTSGVYGTNGGFIAFLNGTVKWYENLKSTTMTGKLSKFNSNTGTVNIQEALPTGAVILSRKDTVSL